MKNNVTDGLNKVFEVGTDLVEVEKEIINMDDVEYLHDSMCYINL